jgi:uncharacterized protein YndB with AHSA1/START domain
MLKKYELEFTLNTSPKVLFNRLSTPSGLAEWFADDVNLVEDQYTFIWDGYEQAAEVLSRKDNSHIRFRWAETVHEHAYFEFRIQKDELTGDLALIITDFSEENEKDDAIELWNTQIAELKHAIGL